MLSYNAFGKYKILYFSLNGRLECCPTSTTNTITITHHHSSFGTGSRRVRDEFESSSRWVRDGFVGPSSGRSGCAWDVWDTLGALARPVWGMLGTGLDFIEDTFGAFSMSANSKYQTPTFQNYFKAFCSHCSGRDPPLAVPSSEGPCHGSSGRKVWKDKFENLSNLLLEQSIRRCR